MIAGFSVDDLWTAADGRALPRRPILEAIAGRCGRAWDCPDLAGRVKIDYAPRLRTTLGRATLDDGRVELNPRLLLEHPAELVPTLAHELAHLVVYWRYGRVAPHGAEFRTLMRAVNLSPAATHQLDVGRLKRRRRRFVYLHKCTHCHGTFAARRVYRNYYCVSCGPDSTWEVFRVPDTPEGRRLLKAAAT